MYDSPGELQIQNRHGIIHFRPVQRRLDLSGCILLLDGQKSAFSIELIFDTSGFPPQIISLYPRYSIGDLTVHRRCSPAIGTIIICRARLV